MEQIGAASAVEALKRRKQEAAMAMRNELNVSFLSWVKCIRVVSNCNSLCFYFAAELQRHIFMRQSRTYEE